MLIKSIFEETNLNNLKIKNRLFRSATWEGLAQSDGKLTDEIYKIYEDLAKGGVGLIVTGLTDISQYNRALPGTMRLYSDELIPDYKKLTDCVKKYDCRILTQININKYIKENKETGFLVEKDINELNQEDITDIISLFVNAAKRAKESGFDGIQIHSAFGWFLNRFINPFYNRRYDKYGGTAETRSQLLIEIIDEIKKEIPEFYVTTKLGYYSTLSNINDLNDYIAICKKLAEHKIDSIEISINYPHIIGIKKMEEEAEFLPLALEVKKHVNVPIILVGGHRHMENMERILNNTDIEYFSLSRPLIREPNLPNRWQHDDNSKSKCISCDGCFGVYGKRCVFNE